MKKRTIALLVFISAILLSGCASVQMASKEQDAALKAFPPPPPDKAGLYIYRNSSFGSAMTKEVYVDNVLLGETASYVYLYKELLPGLHTVSTESEFSENSIRFQADAGKNYFIEQYIKIGVFFGGANLEMVDEKVGMEGVLECELAEPQ